MKNTIRFEHIPCGFISLYWFVFTSAMKMKSVNYNSHWNSLVFCGQWNMSDLKCLVENVWFCFISAA